MSKPLVMHVDMDAFFASVEIARRPELRGLPVCVGSPVVRRGVVSAASYEARAFGIRAGTPVYQAKELCPQAVFVAPDFELYAATSQKIKEILLEVTPDVEHTSIDEAFLKLEGLERRFENNEAIANYIKQRIKQECNGITCSVGIAQSRACAKAASDYHKPNGYTEVLEPMPFLASLELKDIPGIGRATKAKLNSMGLFAIAQVQELSCETLQQFFGKESGRYLYSIVRGMDSAEVRREYVPPKSLSHTTTLNYNTTDPSVLLPIFSSICDRLCDKLLREGFYAKTMGVTVRYSNFQTTHADRKLPEPLRSARRVFPEAEKLFREMLIPGRPVRLIGVTLSNFVEGQKQTTLFNYKEREREERLVSGVAKIRKDYGRKSIYFGSTIPRAEISSRF